MAPGDAFLCVTGAAKMKVYDRDGKERGESVLGDPYIRDTKNTKGHQSPCTSGHWHPSDRRALPAWLQRACTVHSLSASERGSTGLVCLQAVVACCAAVRALCYQTRRGPCMLQFQTQNSLPL